jgi:hypothetical protein
MVIISIGHPPREQKDVKMKNRHLIMFAMVFSIVGVTLFTHVALAQFTDPIVNGGFETGTPLGWMIDGMFCQIEHDPSLAHTGDYFLWGMAPWTARQDFLPPVNLPNCHLSFWYLGEGEITCYVEYSDGPSDSIGPLIGPPFFPPFDWQEATLPIDPTREVIQIKFEAGGWLDVAIDDVAIIYEGVPPIASFTESDHTAPVGTEITFNASASYDPDGTIVQYEWDWESDGVYDHIAPAPIVVSHTYSADGEYTVTLRVTDNDGLTDTASDTKTITPEVVPEPPVASFTEDMEVVALGTPITFDPSGSSTAKKTIMPSTWVIPEYPFGTIIGLAMCFAALAVFKSKNLRIHL